MVNNLDWTENLSTIDFLRDIGKHFPVNRMLARDVVKTRLEAGISYTEFSYVLLQSMDFLNLFREHGVTLQFGGSDQWGNLTGGVELIRRADGGHAHAFATPLITKADGTKYGKTEGGALWLDPEMMSPYAFYQFWLNQGEPRSASCCGSSPSSPRGDRGARGRARREAVPAGGAARAGRRGHDAGARRRGDPPDRGGVRGAVRRRLAGRRRPRRPGAGAARRPRAAGRPTPAGKTVTDLFVDSGLVQSRGEARRAFAEGGAYLNNERVEDPDYVPGGRRLPRRHGAGAAAGQEELRGRRGR